MNPTEVCERYYQEEITASRAAELLGINTATFIFDVYMDWFHTNHPEEWLAGPKPFGTPKKGTP